MDSVVETSNGKVRGKAVDGIHVFRGVRYGDTTAGGNRFRPPRPAHKWPGIVEANRPGDSAPQLASPMNTDPFFAWYSEIETPSEDCLFLNVSTPGVGAGNRPVMVWIHGGGWIAFSGTAPGFDGTALSRREDVVVVSINHRLGVFGHLSLEGADESFADSGNAGVLDILLALQWVRDNAEAFGGNPANVTVFGESGGASKIAALLSMRKARGLFHRAIVQSSGSGMTLATADEATSVANRLKQVLGLQRLDPLMMQALSMEDILKATSIATGPYRGMIDGRSFLHHPFDGRAPATAIDVPVMFGCTMTEGTYYMRGDPRNFALEIGDVRRRLSRFLEIDGPTTERIIEVYRSEYPAASPSRLLFLCFSDFMFKRATYRMAELQSTSARAPVFAFHFEWETPIEGGRMGSPHTSEVPFIFGTTAAARACVGEGPDLPVMTRTLMAAWAAFARTGNPSHAGIPNWLPYTASEKYTMRLNMQSILEMEPGGVARAALADLPPFGYGHSIPAIVAD